MVIQKYVNGILQGYLDWTYEGDWHEPEQEKGWVHNWPLIVTYIQEVCNDMIIWDQTGFTSNELRGINKRSIWDIWMDMKGDISQWKQTHDWNIELQKDYQMVRDYLMNVKNIKLRIAQQNKNIYKQQKKDKYNKLIKKFKKQTKYKPKQKVLLWRGNSVGNAKKLSYKWSTGYQFIRYHGTNGAIIFDVLAKKYLKPVSLSHIKVDNTININNCEMENNCARHSKLQL